MLKNIKLNTKILLTIGVMLMMMLGMGIIGIVNLRESSAQARKIYEKDVLPQEHLAEIRDDFQRIRGNVYQMIIAGMEGKPEKIAEFEPRVKKYIDQINESIDKLTPLIESEEEQTRVDELKKLLNDFFTSQDQLINLAKTNQMPQAIDLMWNSGKELKNKIQDTLAAITKMEEGQASAETADNKKTAKRTILIMITISLLCTLVGISLGLVLSRSYQSTLKGFFEEMQRLINAAINGQLQTRAQTSRINFEFRPIAEGVNQTLDAVITPLSVAANYVERLSRGDIPPRITEVYHGDFNEIKNNLNKCIDAVNLLVEDSQTLIQAALQGQLQTRADISRHAGDFQTIVQGVNQTLDAVINPLNVAANYVERISRGDIPPRITEVYHGDFNEIKNNLNKLVAAQSALSQAAGQIAQGQLAVELMPRSDHDQLIIAMQAMVNAIKTIIDDANKLATAAVAGNLDFRADAQQHQGDYRAVIEGLNAVMDAIANPLAEASLILQSAAKRDLTQRVAGSYQGQIDDLKSNINSTLVSLDKALSEVAETVSQVTSGADQISSASQSLSQGATEQASSLEEITSSMAEIGSQTKINAENANQANMLAKTARSAAETGQSQMRDMVNAMNDIASSSNQISHIIKVIDEIAFQTNLLALNAAVEAARAGRHGKGFAVVADEVRNLAGRSAKAAKETTELIETSKDKVNTGTSIAQTTSDAFKDIVAGIVKVTDIIGEIAAASSEQAQGVIQINQGLGQIDKVTQQNTANAEETASAAEQLSSQSINLKKLTEEFKLSSVKNQSTPKAAGPAATSAATAPAPSKKKLPDSGWGSGKTKPKISLDDHDFGRF